MTDENETRRCAQGGLLVNGDTRLLTDPSEYYHYGTRVQVGCSRMRCTRCQSMVRCGPPGLGLKDGVKWDLRATYEAADWSTLPWIEERYALFSR